MTIPFFSWFRRRIDLKNPSTWREVSDVNWAGKTVTEASAMNVSTFWGGVKLLTETIGTLPFGLYKRNADGGRDAQTKNPLYTILHDFPNAEQTAPEFWQQMAASIVIWGNAFAEKVMIADRLVALKPLNYLQMVLDRSSGSLVYRYTDAGKLRELPANRVLHIRGFGTGGDLGLSTLSAARQSLSLSMAAEEAQGKTFSEGMRAKGFFVMPGNLTPEQRVQAEKVLVDRYSGPNAKHAGVLEAGVKFEQTMMTSEDAELLLSRRMSVEEVCRFLGVPPIMLGHASEGQTMWGTGVEAILIQFYTMGLRPLLVRIEKAVLRSCVLDKDREEIYPEFNIDALFRADSEGRAALWSTLVQNGIMTRNEVRARENLPRKDGGDILTVQSALVDLANLGQQQPDQNKIDGNIQDRQVVPFQRKPRPA